jgi:hypothetical protein
MFDAAVASGSISRIPLKGLRDPRRVTVLVRRAALAVALGCAGFLPVAPLAAQAHLGGERRGTMAEHRSSDAPTQPAAPADSIRREVEREIEQLAPLEEALHDVHGLTPVQTDSLAVLEQRYARVFASLAISARGMIDSTSSQGIARDIAELRALCETVWNVRGSELFAARALLTTRAQRARFDANVAKIYCEESELIDDLWKRSSGQGDGGTRT